MNTLGPLLLVFGLVGLLIGTALLVYTFQYLAAGRDAFRRYVQNNPARRPAEPDRPENPPTVPIQQRGRRGER